MITLVINVGSSSVKYSVFNKEKEVFSDLIERVGVKKGISYNHAFKLVKTRLDKNNITDIKAVGHRFVHGGKITKPSIITKSLLANLYKVKDLAPLHNIPELKGIEACMKFFSCKHVVVFDTSFHSSMPKVAYSYALSEKLTKKHNIRRYGFHGMSHQFVSEQVKKLLKKKPKRLITCHLGNGASIAAIKNQKSIDTSMGFTPLEGLMMGTRCGDIDPAIPLFLATKEKIKDDELLRILNHESGLQGISGFHDFRDVTSRKDKKSKLAFQMYVYRVTKYIGAYTAILGGLDALVFTGGIGENSSKLRKAVLNNLEFLGISLDSKKNNLNASKITTTKSKIPVFVIKTNEALEIARIVNRILK